jgi:hypothetical protein
MIDAPRMVKKLGRKHGPVTCSCGLSAIVCDLAGGIKGIRCGSADE